MKTCTKCNKVLPETYFHKKGKKLRSACKECTNAQNRARHEISKDDKNAKARAFYQKHKNRFKARSRKYRQTDAGQESLRKCREKFMSTEHGKESVRQSIKKYSDNNKEKRRCHWRVKAALKSGKIVRRPCCVCGNVKVHAHHPDYTKPLYVIWLCRKHHCEEHRK
jgi:hypothetical protein